MRTHARLAWGFEPGGGGVHLIREVGGAVEAEAPGALESPALVAALDAAEARTVETDGILDVKLMCLEIVMLGRAGLARANSLEAFAEMGVLMAERATAVLASPARRVGAAPEPASEIALALGHAETVPAPSTAVDWAAGYSQTQAPGASAVARSVSTRRQSDTR